MLLEKPLKGVIFRPLKIMENVYSQYCMHVFIHLIGLVIFIYILVSWKYLIS